MAKRELLLFDKPSPTKHTAPTLEAAKARALELHIGTVVVATNTGETVLKALKIFEGTSINIIGVTLHAGRWNRYVPPDPEKIKAAEDLGVHFVTATHALMGHVGSAIREKFGGIDLVEIIAHTYYTFGQGMKVAVEIALMAADAGLLEDSHEIISVAGTDKGADTAIVLTPAFSTRFFDVKIREVIAMVRGH